MIDSRAPPGRCFSRTTSARQFPALFAAVAEGRLHLSAVLMLRPHLTPENADDLIRAATHHSKSQIAQLLANRFPRPDVPTQVRPLAPPPCSQLAASADGLSVPERITPRPKVTPLAPERFAYQFTASEKAPIEERVRLALRSTHLRATYQGPPRTVQRPEATA